MLNNNSILNKMQRLVHKHLREVPLLHLKACLCLIKTLQMFPNMKHIKLAVHFNSTMKMLFFYGNRNHLLTNLKRDGSHAPFGTYSKHCNIMHQVLRSPISDEDTLRKREKLFCIVWQPPTY